MTPITPEWLYKIAAEVEKDPTRWTQGAMAYDENKNAVNPKNTAAKCWCIRGFAMRDGISTGYDFLSFWADVAKNDSLKTPAEFVAWLREMAKEMEVRS